MNVVVQVLAPCMHLLQYTDLLSNVCRFVELAVFPSESQSEDEDDDALKKLKGAVVDATKALNLFKAQIMVCCTGYFS